MIFVKKCAYSQITRKSNVIVSQNIIKSEMIWNEN